jgi:hypothetical protein
MSNDSGRYKALAPTSGVSGIDSAHHEYMYQLNYVNVNTLLYRTGAINTYSTTQTRQTSLFFKSFLYGSPVYALPIKLVEFKTELKDEKGLHRLGEQLQKPNNDYFTIERSEDAINFNSVEQNRGAGTTTNYHYYSTIDESPIGGLSYYRLKQTDFDGKCTYSYINPVYNVGLTEAGLNVKHISPNPFGSNLEIDFSVSSKSNVEITVMTESGKVIDKTKVEVSEGKNKYRFYENSEMSPGTYFVIVSQDNKQIARKIMKE